MNSTKDLENKVSIRLFGLEVTNVYGGKNLIGKMFSRLRTALIIFAFATTQVLAATDLGTGVQYIPAGTNLGIGITSPSELLQVNGGILASTVNGTFLGNGAALTGISSALTDNSLDFDKFSDTMTLDATTTIAMASNDLNFDSNTFVIDASEDNVGIGTASPSTALQVVGTATATRFAGDGSTITGIDAASMNADTLDFSEIADSLTLDASTDISMGTNDLNFETNTLFIDASTNGMGIGTGSPAAQVHIDADAVSSANADLLMTSGADANWILGVDDNDASKFKISNGSSLTADPVISFSRNGDIGIGLSDPSELLSIEGSIALDEITAPGATSGYGKIYVGTDSNLYFLSDTGATTMLSNGSLTDATGDVTSSSTITDHAIVRGDGGAKGVQQSAIIIDDTDNVSGVTSLNIDGTGTSALIVNTDDFVVDATNSNVGVGVTSPGEKLHVVGDAKITVDAHIGANIIHDGDADTSINMATDDIDIVVGNETMINFTEDDTQDIVEIGDDGDIDIKLSSSEDAAVFIEGSTGNVGIGNDTNSPSVRLEVNGSLQINDTLVFDELTSNSSSGNATTVNWTQGSKQKITLDENTTFTFTAPGGVASLTLFLYQDGTGSRTVTWPGTVKWPSDTAPTLTTTAGDLDIVTCTYDGTTNYYCQAGIGFNP